MWWEGVSDGDCLGKVVRSVCVLGFHGLRNLLSSQSSFLFANKLYIGYQVSESYFPLTALFNYHRTGFFQPEAYECLDQWLLKQ